MSRALEELRVLDLATFIAAPFCCTLLGEFGAEVIKVEQPGVGDDLRRLGRRAEGGPAYMWLVESRNKKSITCNLREADGQALIKKLAAHVRRARRELPPGHHGAVEPGLGRAARHQSRAHHGADLGVRPDGPGA